MQMKHECDSFLGRAGVLDATADMLVPPIWQSSRFWKTWKTNLTLKI